MIINKYDKFIPIGISLPIKIVDAIDKKRKDVTRSRYILILEKDILDTDKNLNASFEDRFRASQSNETMDY